MALPVTIRNGAGVMHLTDTLSAGGAERVAVNIVNALPRDRYRSYLCTTRADGPLAQIIDPAVAHLSLQRRGRFDVGALAHLVRFINKNEIDILHAHQTSVFTAVTAARFAPRTQVIWHDHYGRAESDTRSSWLYRHAVKRTSGVIAVTDLLAEWSRTSLRVPADRVWYLPNFVCQPGPNSNTPELPGRKGQRVVCVANFRRQKDHLTLLQAFAAAVMQVPEAHLLLVGVEVDHEYIAQIRSGILNLHLENNVTVLGESSDVGAILQHCDIGVLSSVSEGLPLSLIEYGMIGLPSIATRVGQCAEVLDEGRAGLLVPPSSAESLSSALITLLRSIEKRTFYGNKFRQRVLETYSASATMNRICTIYDQLLQPKRSKGKQA